MSGNEALIHRFYSAFQQKDFRTMQSCYHENATFSDPVFQDLSSSEVKAMWQMLLTASADLKISFKDVYTNDKNGRAHWEAWYTFTTTGRKVHNIIDATFEFREGKIIKHTDVFNFWRWSRMALGIAGLLLGWTPIVQNRVKKTARRRLDKFLSANP